MKALISEQDRAARSALEVALAQRGHRTATCSNLHEVLHELNAEDYSLLVIGLPADQHASMNDLQRVLDHAEEHHIVTMLVVSPGMPRTEFVGVWPGGTIQISRPINSSELRDKLSSIEQLEVDRKGQIPEPAGNTPVSSPLIPVIRHLADLVLVLNDDAVIQSVGISNDDLTGSFADELSGHPLNQFVHPADREILEAAFKQISQPDQRVVVNLRFFRPDDGWMDAECRLVNLTTDQHIKGYLVAVRDVSRKRQVETDLQEARYRLSGVTRNSPLPQFVVDANYVVTGWSGTAEEEFGWTEEEMVGTHVLEWFPVSENDRVTLVEVFEQLRASEGAVQRVPLGVGTREGKTREFDWYCTFVADTDVWNGSFVCQGYSSGLESLREETYQKSEDLVPYLVQNATEMLLVVNPDYRITYQSPAVERGLGYSEPMLRQTDILDLVHHDDRQKARASFQSALSQPGEPVHIEMRLRHANSSWRYIEATITNHVSDTRLNGLIINARDITERKSLEQRLTRHAFFDALTRLPNRALFMHRLDQALWVEGDGDHPVAVLFLDLDRLKIVNDSLGHEIGDRLLVAIAQRLRETVRPGDTVARLSGDEFIILLRGVANEDEATQIARRVIGEVRAPVQLNGYEVTVSTSIGVATARPGEITAQDLLRNADIALYRAKDLGAGNYVVFDASMARQAVARLELENDLRQAIHRHEFRIHYLPEFNLQTGKLSGLEVLVRWRHPERGYVMPDEFMDVAEETGLIVPIGRWLTREACQQMQRWLELHPEAAKLTLSINLSAREFQQPDLVPFIMSILDQYGLKPKQLRLEIAEKVMIVNPAAALEKLDKLREQRVGLALDNFGSGFSSLSYLTQVSIGTLKIDRQFISGPGGVMSNLSIVRAITSLAHALGMNVTAEGIESGEHLTRVRSAGCDFGQGSLFSEPLDGPAVESLLFDR